MSEYEIGPEWSYMGVTVADRRGCSLPAASGNIRLKVSLGLIPRVRRSYLRWDRPLSSFGNDWQGAYNSERQRVEDNRERWMRENASGMEQRAALVARAVEAAPSRVNRTALVAYRCKSHGCLLGALAQVQGRRYQLWRQSSVIGLIPGDHIDEWHSMIEEGYTPSLPNPDMVSEIMDSTNMEDYEKDGRLWLGHSDWVPESLSEWLNASDGEQNHGLTVNCAELAPWSAPFDGVNMNCRHVEHNPDPDEVEADVQRLRGQRKRVVQVDSRGPVRRGK